MNEQEFWAALQPVEAPQIFYRLYYNDSGDPLFFSMEDLPGNYITVDRETYVSSPANIRVVNGKIKRLDLIHKLKPGKGTPCDYRDVAIVVDTAQKHIKWSLQSNETN